jgi:hypothetical protein
MQIRINDMVIAKDVEGTLGLLNMNQVYRVECVTHRGQFVRIENLSYEFASTRFEKYPYQESETLTLPEAANN